jgi:prepilin-type N-terminal cleavage/methylation domain-containing protein
MRSRTGLPGSGGDAGFTLIELLVAIVILGIITVPLSNVVIAYLRNTDATTARLIESHDAQISSAYWAQDVASIGTRETTTPFGFIQSVETGVAYNSGLYPCGAAGTPSAIVRLAWDDSNGPAVDPTLVRVAYVVQTVSGQTELHRLRCEGSAATKLIFTVVSDVTLAHDLDPSTPPALGCSTTCTASPAVPKSITLTLAIKDPKNLGGAYVVRLTGQRRQS